MTGKVFVDSNILIYAHDLDAGPKQYLAAKCADAPASRIRRRRSSCAVALDIGDLARSDRAGRGLPSLHEDYPEQPDNIALFQFVGLLGALSVVYLIARA